MTVRERVSILVGRGNGNNTDIEKIKMTFECWVVVEGREIHTKSI